MKSSHALARARAFVAVAVAVLLTSAFTYAGHRFHIGLASSVPAKDSHVTTSLKEIRLTFTGRIDVTKAGADLLTADGKTVALDSLRAVVDSPKVAVVHVVGPMTAGNYTVKWRAVAADGANGSGSFGFMYMPVR